ncbi:HEAT repeat-containing protein 3 [Bacillus rossius redtenbacheri]|uniref:HEAT repeat-containing protein 3 n=1 Tax=Bacillus rossius redtenbacheri TaxID=93214 RepID=UPI002FDE23A9
MGKTRRQRKRPKYKNPTGLLSVKDTQQEEGEHSAGDQISKNEIAISAVLDQLQSPDVEHKVFGLQTLATVFTEPCAVQEAVRHEVVRVAAPLLLDASASVRHVAAGALRNLSAGGHELCDLLVEQDVMTPLSALLQEYAVDWQPLKNSKVTDKKADTFLQAVHLLWNLCESNGTAVKYFNDRNMLPVLARCLDTSLFGLDIVTAAAQCIQTVTEDNSTAVSQLQSSEPILRQLLMLEGDQPAMLLVRTLAADGEDDVMDQDSSDTSDEMLSDAACDYEGDAVPLEKLPISLLPEVHEGVTAHQLVRKVWEKTVQAAENVLQMLGETEEGQQVLRKLATLRSRAFLCLNNLVSCLDVDDLGGCDKLYHMWTSIASLIITHRDVDDSVLEAASAALRAVLQRLGELGAASYFSQLAESDLTMLFERQQHCKDANVRANLIRSVGILGSILVSAQTPASHQLVKAVGTLLLEAAAGEAELWVGAEALDTLMDVFAEDETDRAAADIDLVQRLRALLPAVRHKVRQQRKCLGDHHLVVTTVNANLKRFIAYKGRRLAARAPSNGCPR